MKKILSLVVMMLATAVTVFAAEKTVWEGSEPISWNTDVAPGTQFETPSGTFTGLSKGDVIKAYTTTTYESPQYVMTYKKGTDWDWTDLETTISGGVISYTVADETVATEIAERGLVFRGQAYTLTKITVETPESGDETAETVIWEGSTAIDWGATPGISVSLTADKFATAKAGDKLLIEGTASEGIQVQVCVNYPWKQSDSYTALPIEYEIAAEDLANIQANGMTIAGQNATITKVTLVKHEEPEPDPEPVTYPIVVWTGEQVIDWGSNPSTWQTISRDKFAQMKAGDILRIQYKEVKAGAMMGLQYSIPDNWALLPGVEIMSVDGLATRLVLTQDMLDAIKSGDLHITG